jgi:aspartyl-tRNA(Asn)/glutamyl-tRNA(Gln) amidotransferase subunit C
VAPPITIDDVRRIAELARIGVEESRLPSLVGELSAILEHMAVLREVDTEGAVATTGPGAGGTPLREDSGMPIPLAHPLESFAPRMHHGFLLVPRLASHEESEGSAAEES